MKNILYKNMIFKSPLTSRKIPSLRSLWTFYRAHSQIINIKRNTKALKTIAEVKHTHNVAWLPLREASDHSMANSSFSDASLSPNEPWCPNERFHWILVNQAYISQSKEKTENSLHFTNCYFCQQCYMLFFLRIKKLNR